MKLQKFTFLILLSAVIVSSCRKHNKKNSDDIDAVVKKSASTANNDVHIAGYAYAANGKHVAAYWKNGVLQKLSDSTSDVIAYGIVLQDTDVVIAGTSTHSNTDFSTDALYWRNGRLILLEKNAEAKSVATSPCGCDLYVGGDYRINSSSVRAAYWKDGIRHELQTRGLSSQVLGITTHGADVYATGIVSTKLVAYAVYWKNDTIHNLSDTLTNSSAMAIAVYGNDVYIVGQLNEKATVWKNGIPTSLVYSPLPNAIGFASSIAIENGDVYISGGVSGDVVGVYWKNGVAATLINGAVEDDARAITVKDGNVYVAGDGTFEAGFKYPVYWSNTTVTRLPGGAYASGTSIVVKAKQ